MEVGSDLIDDRHFLSSWNQHCLVCDSKGVTTLKRLNDETIILILIVNCPNWLVVAVIESDVVRALC